MQRRGLTLAVAAAFASLAPAASRAAPDRPVVDRPVVDRPVVIELFTSEGCSSCPPADALLRELARTRADVLPLAFHVTYWNGLGWRDPFSFEGATARQRAYAGLIPSEVYTPQLVIDGGADVVGSDRRAVLAAIDHAARAHPTPVSVSLRREAGDIVAEVAGGGAGATVLLVGYDPERTTQVGRGENSGRTLIEANIVRSVARIGEVGAAAVTFRRKIPEGARLAVLVQAADGRITGAAREASGES